MRLSVVKRIDDRQHCLQLLRRQPTRSPGWPSPRNSAVCDDSNSRISEHGYGARPALFALTLKINEGLTQEQGASVTRVSGSRSI
jgi:hypothetical protein